MTPRRSRTVSLRSATFLLVVGAASAFGHGVTTHVETIESGLVTARDAIPSADAASQKVLAKVDALLMKESNETSLANELKSVAKAAKQAGKLDANTLAEPLRVGFATALDGYASDLDDAAGVLLLAADAQGISQKVAQGFAARAARISAATTAARGAATSAAAYAGLARVAPDAAGFSAYDAGTAYTWVIRTLVLTPAAQSLDLDGDRTGDNALGTLVSALNGFGVDFDLNALLSEALTTSDAASLLRFWNVDSFQKDTVVFAGVTAGTDTDMDPTDNGSGSETFTVDAALLAADGNPVVRTGTALKKGKFRLEITGQALELAGIALPADSFLVAEGTATPTTNDGLLGGAIPVGALQTLLADAGITIPAPFDGLLAQQADLDLDGDGQNDALSVCFTYTAVGAAIVAQ